MNSNLQRIALLKERKLFISCVIPVYNEEANLKPFIHEMDQYLQTLSHHYEMIVINDGSKDQTKTLLNELTLEFQALKIINFSRNFGKEMAITAGLEHSSGDVTVIIDADFQHPIEIITLFLNAWCEGYDMAYGIRTSRIDEKPLKRFFAQLFYQLMRKISQSDMPPNAGDFRLLDRNVVNAINSSDERVRFMKGLYGWVGFSSIGVPFQVQERQAGESSWKFLKLFELAVTGIVSFSDVPLKIWSFIGVIISLCSFAAIAYILIKTLIFGIDVPGYATLLIAITFFGGVQLLSIGILGEYIARIFSEVKRRPKYIVESFHGFDKQ